MCRPNFSQIFSHMRKRIFLKARNLSLRNAYLLCHLHLSLTLKKSQGKNVLLALGQP